jgi:hypothetical protein
VPLRIRVFEQGDRLLAQATGQSSFPLRYQGEHTFLGPTPTGIRMVFVLDGDVAGSFVLHQAGRALEAKRVAPDAAAPGQVR